METKLFLPKYHVKECLDQIKECLKTGWTGDGFKTNQFETEWKRYTGLEHAIFLNSATAGLHLAVKMLKRKYRWADEDEIITTPLTFVSTNHVLLYEKLRPVFADVDEYLCLDPQDVLKKITSKTKAIMFVGYGGNVGRYYEVVEICKKYNLKLILDAAHMSGTRYDGEIPGKEADGVVYSFHAVKNLPIADAGMLCMADTELDFLARQYAWMGINKSTYARSAKMYTHTYTVEHVGYKYNGNSIMASIGLVQLKYLDHDNRYRRRLRDYYMEYLPESKKLQIVPVSQNCQTSSHIFAVVFEDRQAVMNALQANNISYGVHYGLNTGYPMYADAKNDCPYAQYISEHVLSLPMHLGLKRRNIRQICRTISSAL